jgi:hypothetical protein
MKNTTPDRPATYIIADEPDFPPFTLDEFIEANEDTPMLAETITEIAVLDVDASVVVLGATGVDCTIKRVS